MRFLHTADWHLGKTLNERSLLEDQEYMLDKMLQWMQDNPPDALFVCGDIYDRSLPSKEAVRLLDDFLKRSVLHLGVPTFLIAGNHDSPERISYASELLEGAGLYVRGHPDVPLTPIELGEARIYMWPYTELGTLRMKYSIDALSMEEALQELFSQTAFDPEAINIFLGHEYVLGGIESDSERPLLLGNASALSSEIFAPFDLVLLGHLHRPQAVRKNHILYSGSLLKYSKSEAGNVKSVYSIDIDKQKCAVTPVSFSPLRDLRILKGTFMGLLGDQSEDYVYLELEDKQIITDAMSRLRRNYPNALGLEYVALENRRPEFIKGQMKKEADLLTLFSRFYMRVRGEEIPVDYARAAEELVRELEDK